MRLVATITSKGQLTIPAALRAKWELSDGDKIDFYLDEASGAAQILPRNKKLADLAGFLHAMHPDAKPPSQEDIDKAVAEQVTADHERIIRESEEFRAFKEWKRRKANAVK